MRKPVLLICGLAMAAPLMAQDQGLHATADDLSSPRWQARFERIASPLDGRVTTPLWMLGQSARTLQLFGDYQFSNLRLGQTGGLRITGGVLLNLRPAGLAGHTADASRRSVTPLGRVVAVNEVGRKSSGCERLNSSANSSSNPSI